MSHRHLAIVSAVTVGDFALWNWSLSASSAALALISGLTLIPLVGASAFLLALATARLASRLTWRSASSVFSRRRAFLVVVRYPVVPLRAVRLRAVRGSAGLDSSSGGQSSERPARKQAA